MADTKFKPGATRPAASGRKKGTPNKKTLEFQAILEGKNFSPGEELIYVYQEAKKLYQWRKKNRNISGAMTCLDTMATTADKICQFVYPKKKAVEHTGEVGVKTFADFIALADEDDDLGDDDQESNA